MIPTHIKRGDPIPPTDAAFWNAVIEVVAAHRAGKRRFKPPPLPQVESYVWVRNKSDSERDYQFGDVIAFDDPVFDVNDTEEIDEETHRSKISLEYFKHPVFDVRDAEWPKDIGKFGLVLDPIPKGAAGRVLTIGTMFVRVDLKEDWHHFADVQSQKDAEDEDPEERCTRLRSGVYGGAQILWRPDPEDETDSQWGTWCVVRIGGLWNDWTEFELVDKLVENHKAKAHAVWYDRENDESHEDERDELVQGWKCGNRVWEPGKRAWCKLRDGRWWWLIPEDCGRPVETGDEGDAEEQEDEYREEGLLPPLEEP